MSSYVKSHLTHHAACNTREGSVESGRDGKAFAVGEEKQERRVE